VDVEQKWFDRRLRHSERENSHQASY